MEYKRKNIFSPEGFEESVKAQLRENGLDEIAMGKMTPEEYLDEVELAIKMMVWDQFESQIRDRVDSGEYTPEEGKSQLRLHLKRKEELFPKWKNKQKRET